MRLSTLVALLLVSPPVTIAAQSAPPLGTWDGRSTCTIADSPCKNEVVVYDIRHDSTSKDVNRVAINADKVVNGVRDYMGTIPCAWTAPALNCVMPNGTWNFQLLGDTLSGTLVTRDGRLFRRVEVTRRR
jgi:hypothetical protein